MQDNAPDQVLQFCDKELEHLRLEQEFVLHELAEYKQEKSREVQNHNPSNV